MNDLLTEVVEAHGGIDRRREPTRARVTLISGGDLFAAKGQSQDATPRSTPADHAASPSCAREQARRGNSLAARHAYEENAGADSDSEELCHDRPAVRPRQP
ncbi:hypothetical protein [Streptomyces sp. NPDC003483]